MVRTPVVTVATAVALIVSALGASRTEPEAVPVPLFDGKTLRGWTDINGNPPSPGWEVVDGAIHRRERAGDLVTDSRFENFDLRFEWKIARGGNSGLKYRTALGKNKKMYGCEYQLLDDDNHPNGKKATTRAGSLYDLIAPAEADKVLKPVGEYNESRVVARGSRIEHWLNGRKILDVDTAGDDWKNLLARSKFKAIKDFASEKPGPILLQDHGNEVWFRSIEIRPLSPHPTAD
jgi:hypothetical protein